LIVFDWNLFFAKNSFGKELKRNETKKRKRRKPPRNQFGPPPTRHSASAQSAGGGSIGPGRARTPFPFLLSAADSRAPPLLSLPRGPTAQRPHLLP